MMSITVTFYSYLKDLTGTHHSQQSLPDDSSLADLLEFLFAQFPKLRDLKRSILVAVDLEYQTVDYILKPGDEVALFPPVQGG